MDNTFHTHAEIVGCIERLLTDTNLRILSAGCVDTSNEVKRDKSIEYIYSPNNKSSNSFAETEHYQLS